MSGFRVGLGWVALALLTAGSAPGPETGPGLVLKRVMLSTGGVGYFEYEASIDGSVDLGLDVPLGEVDDVLKSLVVYDSAGGVGGFDLPQRDAAHAAFGDVPFGPEALQTPLAYLNALKGTEIEVAGPKPLKGRILEAEPVETEIAGGAHLRHTLVTVLAADGLKQFVLEDAESVQVADPALRAGIGRALEELRRAASHDMRHLTLHTTGTGRRIVRVGYVVAAPLWKATYRLVLPEAGATKGRLQGWAVLENESGVDWNGVELTLQSGNPVTFRQALYQAYYVDRPEVPVEVLGRILPDLDARSVAVTAERRAMAPARAMNAPAPAPLMDSAAAKAAESDALAEPTESAAAADEGEATTFRLPTPVFLPAAHTASVPILDHDVTAERLDLLQGDRPHPLAAVRLLNETGEALPAGVLTLYAPGEAARFAGDARLGGLPAGETRLLSFAEDLRTTAERHVEQSLRVGSVTAAGGVLKIEERDRQALKVRLTAPAMEKQTVLVEIPKEQDRTITIEAGQPPVTEETATAWRIAVALKPGETRSVSAWLDRTLRNDMVLASTDPASLVALTREDGMSASAYAALQHLVALQQAVTDRSDRLRQFDAGIAAIGPDEQRIRQNLASVSNGDALHGRLLRELEADEDKLAGIQHDREQAETALDAARRDLAQAIETLSL